MVRGERSSGTYAFIRNYQPHHCRQHIFAHPEAVEGTHTGGTIGEFLPSGLGVFPGSFDDGVRHVVNAVGWNKKVWVRGADVGDDDSDGE